LRTGCNVLCGVGWNVCCGQVVLCCLLLFGYVLRTVCSVLFGVVCVSRKGCILLCGLEFGLKTDFCVLCVAVWSVF